MAESAKWIKVSTDTFEDEKINLIEGMPSGDQMIITWIKLLLLAGKCNAEGYLLLQEDIPFTAEMLGRIFKQELSIINLALSVFQRYKMIRITAKGIYITNFNKYQDLDKLNQKRAQDRERKQRQREKEKLLLNAAKDELVAVEEENMSRVTSQKNNCDLACDIERDSSYSTSTSNSKSYSNSFSSLNNSINNKLYIQFFNNNFHQSTEYEQNILTSYEEKGIDPEGIALALEEAVEKNAKDLKYVKKILDRWLNNGILTIEAVKADKEDFERKKNCINGTKNKTSNFNNFQQREYDFDTLEKKLLGWDLCRVT